MDRVGGRRFSKYHEFGRVNPTLNIPASLYLTYSVNSPYLFFALIDTRNVCTALRVVLKRANVVCIGVRSTLVIRTVRNTTYIPYVQSVSQSDHKQQQ